MQRVVWQFCEEWTFKRALKNYGSLYLACNDRKAFFTSSDQSRYTLWSCQNVCDALSYLLDNIYIRFGTKLYRQIVGIPMGTNCAPLVRFKPASNFVLLIVPSRYFCGGSFCFMSWCLKIFLCCWRLMYVFIFLVKLR